MRGQESKRLPLLFSLRIFPHPDGQQKHEEIKAWKDEEQRREGPSRAIQNATSNFGSLQAVFWHENSSNSLFFKPIKLIRVGVLFIIQAVRRLDKRETDRKGDINKYCQRILTRL